MSDVIRKPITPDMTLREVVGMSLDEVVTAGGLRGAGLLQIAVVLADGRKAVVTVTVASEIVEDFPEMLPGSGGMTMQ